MSFRNFDDFNEAQKGFIMKSTAPSMSSILTYAMQAKALAGRLVDAYSRMYTRLQILVVNKKTGKVSDETTPERLSATENVITASCASLLKSKSLIERGLAELDIKYSGTSGIVPHSASNTANVLIELCGGLLEFNAQTQLQEILFPERIRDSLDKWDTVASGGTLSEQILYFPNICVRLSGGDQDAYIYGRYSAVRGRFVMVINDYVIAQDGDSHFTLYDATSGAVEETVEGGIVDAIAAACGVEGSSVAFSDFHWNVNQPRALPDNAHDGDYASFSPAKFVRDCIYPLETIDNVVNSL